MLYFAFGSNLLIKQMVGRCPGAVPVCRATLRFYNLNYRSNPSGKGVATIDRNDQRRGAVHGALYQVTREDLKKLDRFEGFPNVYYRMTVTVETKWGRVKAFTYVMHRDKYQPKNPDWEYLNRIQSGYRDWKIPLEKLNIKATGINGTGKLAI